MRQPLFFLYPLMSLYLFFFFLWIRRPPISTLFPSPPLFRSRSRSLRGQRLFPSPARRLGVESPPPPRPARASCAGSPRRTCGSFFLHGARFTPEAPSRS